MGEGRRCTDSGGAGDQQRLRPLEQQALAVLDSPDKLAVPVFHRAFVYNTWRDKDHVRGILFAAEQMLAEHSLDEPRAIAAAIVAAGNPSPKYITSVGSNLGAFLSVFLDKFPNARGQ